MARPFSTVPSTAKVSPAPFKVSISDDRISELQTLVKLSKLAPSTYEGLQKDRRLGITTEWLASAKEKWQTEFDWRQCEEHINSFPQFTTEIEGLTIHFAALFSEKEDAVPIALFHGWPGSFLEFLPILSLFRDEYEPSKLPYHLIIPSLPGYTFSSGPPLDRDFGIKDIGRIMNELMTQLGFGGGYVAQGGDIGSRVARILAAEYESCKAAHINFCNMRKPSGVDDTSLTPFEERGLVRIKAFITTGSAYALEQGTRPSTIGHVLSTNPVALLAWIGEKFLDWVDEPLPLSTILESVSLYWFTESFPRAIYPYRQNYPPPDPPFHMDPKYHISKPFGYSAFPMEVVPVPKAWVETTGNLVFHREHEKGGHFAALERPADMKKDVTDFVEQVWPGIQTGEKGSKKELPLR